MQQFEVIGISQFRDHLKLVKPQLEVRSSNLLSNYIFFHLVGCFDLEII